MRSNVLVKSLRVSSLPHSLVFSTYTARFIVTLPDLKVLCSVAKDTIIELDLGSIRSSPRYGCTEFVYPECLHFDNDDKIDDVLLEHGRLPHVLPLAVHLRFFSLIDK